MRRSKGLETKNKLEKEVAELQMKEKALKVLKSEELKFLGDVCAA